MPDVEQQLLAAQDKARALFAEVVDSGMIREGVLESELSAQIHALARRRYGLSRHWHQRIVRSGPNTLLTYHDKAVDRLIEAGDTVYLDFGPIFDGWEADFGRTYVLGTDPRKHQLVCDITAAFASGKQHYAATPGLTAGALYDYVCVLAHQSGWEFGAATAGHLVGHFPHETARGQAHRLQIRHGNDLDLREPDANGMARHWILEIHFVDRERQYGGFLEELLTL